jgi:hypothetical protein
MNPAHPGALQDPSATGIVAQRNPHVPRHLQTAQSPPELFGRNQSRPEPLSRRPNLGVHPHLVHPIHELQLPKGRTARNLDPGVGMHFAQLMKERISQKVLVG